MKKILVVLLIGLMVFSVGCTNSAPEEVAEQEADTAVFPENDLKIIVPFDPGGGVDVTCRIIASLAPDALDDKSIIVENVPGGGGVIGQTAGAQADPDGYTVLAYTSSVISNPMTKETVYTHESFAPVAMYCFDPDVLIVPADSPFNTVQELIDYAKENEVTLTTPGNASAHHIAGMILEDKTGVKFSYIHNDGAAMQIAQIMGGHVDCGLMTLGEAVSQIQEGSLKSLGIMSDERAADLPDLQTFQEQGLDIMYGAWRGLAVPVDTPDDRVEALGEIFEKIIDNDQFKTKMAEAGIPMIYRGPEEFKAYVDQQAENLKIILPKITANQ